MVDAFCSLYTKDYRHVLKDDEPEKALPCLLFDAEENFLPEKDPKVIYSPQRDEEVIRSLARKRMQTTYQISYKDPDGRRASDSFSDEFMNYFNKAFGERTHPVLRPPETCRRTLAESAIHRLLSIIQGGLSEMYTTDGFRIANGLLEFDGFQILALGDAMPDIIKSTSVALNRKVGNHAPEVNGYSRFDFYYTGRTTYQEEISLEAYKLFKRDFDEGISRLFKKRESQRKIAGDQAKD